MKIKICGLFREDDIDFVNLHKPDYIGFVFAKSRRQISFKTAARLKKKLDNDILPVGVFVDSPTQNIIDLYNEGVIALAQLHGNEDGAYIASLKKNCNLPIIKSISADNLIIPKDLGADYILFDSLGGGSGKSFDWNILDAFNIANLQVPFFLAGGINIDNIKEACRTNAFCIDVSSGCETDGKKDCGKIKSLIEIVKESYNG